MSIINAIARATGARIYELPAKPEKVKAALDEIAVKGQQDPPKKYYLGSDFLEEMEDIRNHPVERPAPPSGPRDGH
jgi:aldehyde oxidoreductase